MWTLFKMNYEIIRKLGLVLKQIMFQHKWYAVHTSAFVCLSTAQPRSARFTRLTHSTLANCKRNERYDQFAQHLIGLAISHLHLSCRHGASRTQIAIYGELCCSSRTKSEPPTCVKAHPIQTDDRRKRVQRAMFFRRKQYPNRNVLSLCRWMMNEPGWPPIKRGLSLRQQLIWKCFGCFVGNLQARVSHFTLIHTDLGTRKVCIEFVLKCLINQMNAHFL